MAFFNSNKLILAHDVISSISNANNLPNEVKNAYKINRLILDVLTKVLQTWLASFIISNRLAQSVSDFFAELIKGIEELNKNQFKIERSFRKSLSEIKKTLNDVKKPNNNQYSNIYS